MMFGYGLINSLSQLVVRPLTDRITSAARQKEMKLQMETKYAMDMETVRLNKQIEQEYHKGVQEYCHRLRLKEAQSQFEKQLQMWQLGQFNEKMWPLRTPFDHPSLRLGSLGDSPTPINVFLAETDQRSPFSLNVKPELKNRLSSFLQTVYQNDPKLSHPLVCRIGDWKDGFQDAAFINALWYGMQGQPTIVINPIMAEYGETLDLNVSMWGLGEVGYAPKTQNVVTGSFASAIGRIKKEMTQEWISCGLPVDSKEMMHNRDLLKREEMMQREGNGAYIDKLLTQYQLPKEIQSTVYTKFSKEYSNLVSCITGLYSDIYHLLEYGSEPYMPTAVSLYNIMTDGKFKIPEIAIRYYRKALTNMVCTNYLQDRLPLVYLRVANSLSYSRNDAMQIFQEGVGLWVNKKLELHSEVEIPTSLDECLRILNDCSSDFDKSFIICARDTLISLNETEAADDLNFKISRLSDVTISKEIDQPQPLEKAPDEQVKVEQEHIANITKTDNSDYSIIGLLSKIGEHIVKNF